MKNYKIKLKQGNKDKNNISTSSKVKAILLADSFTKTFHPISLELPKVLMPLVNVPMIEYSLEFLAQNNIEHIFIFCSSSYKLIEDYINNSKWKTILDIQIISCSQCKTSVQAMRELDNMGIIDDKKEPFVIISGDVIANINLKKAIEFHKERCRIDEDCVMTVIFKEIHKEASIRKIDDDLRVGLDLKTSQIVIFNNDTFSQENNQDNLRIPFHIFKEHPKMCIRSDLLDCNIDICSPSFMCDIGSVNSAGYKDIHNDYIRNEVEKDELAKHFYGYIVQSGEYAARVHDPKTYNTISRDIINGWISPFNPDSKIFGRNYNHIGKFVYQEKDVDVHRMAIIEESVVLGHNTKIEEGTKICRTVIGRNCKIGKNVKITDSYIWDNVVIEDGAEIDHAVICNNVNIKKDILVPCGSIISFGVVVDTNLDKFCRINLIKNNYNKELDEDSDEDSDEENNIITNINKYIPDRESKLLLTFQNSSYQIWNRTSISGNIATQYVGQGRKSIKNY